MKKEDLKELINKELERTHLKYHIRGVYDYRISNFVEVNEFIFKELEIFGTRKIRKIELSYEVKSVKFYLKTTHITMDLLIKINDENVIIATDINVFK